MQVTKALLSSLKQNNVSKDAEKTKRRVKEDFLSIRNKQKTEIVELSGLKRTSIYRVFREGSISAKIALAMAQILNVSPYYYSGETDEKEAFNESLLQSFLTEKGYSRLWKGTKPYSAEKAKSDKHYPPNADSPDSGFLFSSAFSNSSALKDAAATLKEEEAMKLLQALLIRERAGGNAAQIADFVKRCLLM